MIDHLEIISAGAGSGKTYSLSNKIVEAIKSGVSANHIMATTFTVKAANELLERIRKKLLDEGHFNEATLIMNGYVGTMNSVFGRLLQEFALDLGLSPTQTVLPEREAQALFNETAAKTIDEYYQKYADVIYRMKMDNWRETISQVLAKARQNGLDADQVRSFADTSWLSLKSYLSSSSEDGSKLDQKIEEAMKIILSKASDFQSDLTKQTKDEVNKFHQIFEDWQHHGMLTWPQWAQLHKLKPAKASQYIVETLNEVASHHFHHSQLPNDIHDAIKLIFHCAADTMDQYADAKKKRGFVDFTDQEFLALQLFSNKQFEEALKDRISHVFVDEFQDSSPLQLTLITRLARLAEKSIWVGDMKQAIFGFRSTDPILMAKAMEYVGEGQITVLDKSYRSRETLVDFVSETFVPLFGLIGIPEQRVKLTADCTEEKLQGKNFAGALESWYFPDVKKVELDAVAIAKGINDLLHEAQLYPVRDKVAHTIRPLIARDIAVLCRTNTECQRVANELSQLGIEASINEGGFFSSPEVILAFSTFRYVINPYDSLAKAEILHLTSNPNDENNWLSEWVEKRTESNTLPNNSILNTLDKIRSAVDQQTKDQLALHHSVLYHLSPKEVLDLTLSSAKIDEVVLAWPHHDKRLINLDRLRHLVEEYENACALNKISATNAGFLLYFKDLERAEQSKRNSTHTFVTGSDHDNAVHVLTYHGAKGLEWPVVILTSLNSSSDHSYPSAFNRPNAFSSKEFSVENPLLDRGLYYWPWPYDRHTKGVGLDTNIQKAQETINADRLNLEENIRLMYVGMTRARDYLIFATRNAQKAAWLDELQIKLEENIPNDQDQEKAKGKKGKTKTSDDDVDLRMNFKKIPSQVRVIKLQENDSGPAVQSTDTPRDDHQSSVDALTFVATIREEQSYEFLPSRFQPSKIADKLKKENKIASAINIESNSTMDDLDDVITDPDEINNDETNIGTKDDTNTGILIDKDAYQEITIGDRYKIADDFDSELGDMVHAFLAADDDNGTIEARLALAETLQKRFGKFALMPDTMVKISDQLQEFILTNISSRCGTVTAIYREWPMHLRKGLQTTSGWMDMVLDTPKGWVLIDHKSFPGGKNKGVERSFGYLPQLKVYTNALEKASGRPVLEAWIHMPIIGSMIGFTRERLLE